MRRRTIFALTAALALLAVPGAASAATESSSNNWSGYVVGGRSFSEVSGSWVQPTANCSSGDGEAAFWVGLGGASEQSQSLEQIGTQAVCAGGQESYYAWYEIVPAGQVKLEMAINPGDKVSAKVSASGSTFALTLTDETSGATATKTVDVQNADTSSAEWIAEAPSLCGSGGGCQTLSLADFGTVNFTGATATADGHSGGISDADWTASAINLSGGAAFTAGGAGDAQPAAGGAQPSDVSSDGTSFSVAWQSADASGGYSGYSGYGGYAGGYPYAYGYWIPG